VTAAMTRQRAAPGGPGRPLRSVDPGTERAGDSLPAGADPAGWVRAGRYGTDGVRTWQLEDTGGGWRLMLDAHVRILAERAAAPDPDFPERAEDGDDSNMEASSDVEITTARDGRRRSRVYRGVRTSNLRKLTPLDQFGPSAWKGADGTSNGRARLFQAINDLSHEYGLPAADFYAVTGWHERPGGGLMFVHPGGAIGGAGEVPDIEVRAGDHLAALRLGDPAAGVELVGAFVEVMALVGSGALPGRVLVPLLAAALRPLFGVYRDPADGGEVEFGANAWVSGHTGGGKSGATAASLNALYPGLTYNRFPLKAGSSKNGGGTGPGLERIAFRARDLLLPFDDLDPSEPDAVRAAWQSNLLRSAFGQYSRLLATRGGGANRAAMPWRAGVVGTGEPLDAEASAENRVANVPIGEGDVRISELRARTGATERAVRGQLGAGLVRIMAGERDDYRARLAAGRVGLRPLFVAGDAPGPVARGADTFAEMAATLRVLLSALVDQGMSTADAGRHWSTIREALREAWRVHLAVIGGGDRATRAIGYLRQAIAAGGVRLDDKAQGNGHPSRDMLGWESRRGAYGVEDRAASQTVGGWQDRETGDLLLLPAVATAAVRKVADQAGDSWTGSTKTLAGALKAGGYLHVPKQTERAGEATSKPRIAGQSRTVWHLLAARFDGDEGPSYGGTDYSGPIDPAGLPTPELDEPAPGCAPGLPHEPTCGDPGCAPGCIHGVTCGAPGAPGFSALSRVGDPGTAVPGSRAAELPDGWTRAAGLARCERCHGPGRTVVRDEQGRAAHPGCATKPLRPAAEPVPAAPTAPAGPLGPLGPENGAQRVEGREWTRQAHRRGPVTLDTTGDGPSLAEQAHNVGRALADAEIQVTSDQAAAVLAEFRAATNGLDFRDWYGDTGISAYYRIRAAAGAEARGIPGVERIESERAAAASADAVLHLDYVAADVRPRKGQQVTELDVNGQFLSAAAIELGHGEPIVVDQPRSIGGYLASPGYVRLSHDLTVGAAELPHTHQAFAGIKAGRTLATTTARYLMKHGVELDAAEVVIWPTPRTNHRRHLDAWVRLFREARRTLADRADGDGGEAARLALALVKGIAAVTLGGWIRSDKNRSEFMRRDWSDQVIAESWVRALVGIERAGEAGSPVMGMRRDSAWFLADQAPYEPAGLKTREADGRPTRQLGKWKVSRHAPVGAAIIRAHKSGSAELLNSAIKAAHEAREAGQ
jgi:hypothetical protein